MSWTEVRDREGLPFGGVPHDTIMMKLESTDPELIRAVRGGDPFRDIEDAYEQHARGEIVDWSTDPPGVESDGPRRDPGLSRAIVNRHYNGNSGSYTDMPQHPELFIGFTGNDPRGANLDPRFDMMRGHITARAANLTARMGDNNADHVAERPWTNQAISYAQKEVLRRARRLTHVFTVSKDGRPVGRNVTAGGAGRAAPRGGPEERAPLQGGDLGDLADGADGQARGPGAAAGATGARGAQVGTDADLGEQRGEAGGRAGRRARGGAAPAALAGRADHAWAQDQRTADRARLGSLVAAAANAHRHRLHPGQEQEMGAQAAARAGKGAAPAAPGAAGHGTAVQQDWGAAVAAQVRRAGAPADADAARRAAQLAPRAGEHLEQLVRGVRSGQADDQRRAAQAAQVLLLQAAAAQHLAPPGPHASGRRPAAHDPTRGGAAQHVWLDGRQRAAQGRGLLPHAQSSGGRSEAALGDSGENTFGLDVAQLDGLVGGGGAGLGLKRLRGDQWRELPGPQIVA